MDKRSTPKFTDVVMYLCHSVFCLLHKYFRGANVDKLDLMILLMILVTVPRRD